MESHATLGSFLVTLRIGPPSSCRIRGQRSALLPTRRHGFLHLRGNPRHHARDTVLLMKHRRNPFEGVHQKGDKGGYPPKSTQQSGAADLRKRRKVPMESIISFQRLAFLVKPGTPKGDPLMGRTCRIDSARRIDLPFQGLTATDEGHLYRRVMIPDPLPKGYCGEYMPSTPPATRQSEVMPSAPPCTLA